MPESWRSGVSGLATALGMMATRADSLEGIGMDRDMWMAVKLYLPAALALLAALVLAQLEESIAQHQLLAGIAQALRWASIAAFGLAVLAGTLGTVRFYRAERGLGLLCDCGGLLGRKINGRYGPYRRCLRCSRDVPQREYEALG